MWNDLTMSERADVIKMAVKAGLRDMKSIRDFYDKSLSGNLYKDGGKLPDQKYYSIMERVAKENNPIWNKDRIKEGYAPLSVDEEYTRLLNDNSYDYRGYYEKYPEASANADTHWSDEFKTVYHPSFSNQSKYSGKVDKNYNPHGLPGGNWVDDETFIPMAWQLHANTPKYAEGGSIHIDPSKKGTFTAAATKHGMGVQEFASKVLANKDDYSTAMVKKANFAKNASKWKHGLGGYLVK